MSQFSEMMGSFIRTGNYPMEANYIFQTEQELVDFYKDPINRTTLHVGLFRIVSDNQTLYWAVPDENNNLYFEKLLDINTSTDVENLKALINKEIEERKAGDNAIWGIDDPTAIDPDLNSILEIAEAIINLRSKVENNLTLIEDLQEEIEKLINNKDELEQLIQDTYNKILGNPIPNKEFRTLRGIQDFVQTLASINKNRMDNLQKEIDQIQIGVGLSGDGSYNADQETYYLKSATSVMNALKILDSLINDAISNCNLKSLNTESVSIDIKKEIKKTTISAKVKLSPEPENDILIKSNGIYHNIDTEYQNGILTIKVNGNIRQQHVLGLSSVVDTAYYDPDQESIIIIFRLQNGETQTITIPAQALISEWIVDNSYSNKVVELTKERITSGGADKLSADVRISTNKDNILEKEGNTLLVRGTADNITLGSKNLKEIIEEQSSSIQDVNEQVQNTNTIVSDINTRLGLTESQLTTEIQDRKDEITRVDQKLDDEVANRIQATTDLNNSLNQEISDRIKGDSDTKNLITESNSKISSLQTDLNTLNQSLSTEIQDRKDAIQTLQDDLERESDKLSNDINTLNTSLNDVSADLTALSQKVNSNAEDSKLQDDLLSERIDNLKDQLDNNFNNDDVLREQINQIKLDNTNQDNAISQLESKIDSVKDNVETSVNVKISSLEQALNNEVSRSTEEDNNFRDKISELSSSIANETTRAKSEESVIRTEMQSKVDTLQNNQNSLKEQITNLETNTNSELAKKINSIELLNPSELIYTIMVDGSSIGSINIPKDQFLKSVNLVNETTLRFIFDTSSGITVTDVDLSPILTQAISNINSSINTLSDKIDDVLSYAQNEINNILNSQQELSKKLEVEISRAVQRENYIETRLTDHIRDHNNPHMVTADQVNAYTKDKVDELLDSIKSSSSDNTDSLKDNINEIKQDLNNHINDYDNPHKVTKSQIGLDKVDNTSDIEKPISVAVQGALNDININISNKANQSDLMDHILDHTNPHSVTKEQIGLGNVDNTSDLNKPISLATQMALDKKANINHSHTMADIADLENLPIIKGVISNLGELPETAIGGDKYILTSQIGEGKTRYTLVEYDGSNGTWKQKLLTTGGIACVVDDNIYKLNNTGLERVLDVSDYTYFYNKIWDETKDLIEDIDFEENDSTNDTNQQIRLKITYKTKYGDPNENEVANPYQEKSVKYIDIDKARFLSNAYSRPANQEDVDNGYAVTLGEPLLILVMTTGDHITISLKEALNIYDPVNTNSINMNVSDWTGDPATSYKIQGNVSIAPAIDSTSLHINNNGIYSKIQTGNTNSISLNPNTEDKKLFTANLNIDNQLNINSDVLLSVNTNGLSAKLIWGEYE